MPVGVVKSSADEAAWEKAKAAASKSVDKGSPKFWATVMTIFKKVTGRESLQGHDLAKLAESIPPHELVAGLTEETK